MELVRFFYLDAVLLACSITDYREKKIKNGWLIAELAGAFVFLAWERDLQMTGRAFFTLLLCLAGGFLLYLLRMIGAGDVKLLCVTVLFMAGQAVEVFFIAVLLCAAILALAKLVRYKNGRRRWQYLLAYTRQVLMTGTPEPYGFPEEPEDVIGMALPVFCGALFWHLWVYIIR